MTNVRHVDLIVRDSTKALRLYSKILGFKPKTAKVCFYRDYEGNLLNWLKLLLKKTNENKPSHNSC